MGVRAGWIGATVGALLLLLLAPGLRPASSRAQAQTLSPDVRPAVENGVQYLRSRSGQRAQTGEAALLALALVKADVPPGDPAVADALQTVLERFESTSYYTPQRRGGQDTYEAAVVAMLLASLDPQTYRTQIAAVTQYLIGKQNANGSWDYTNRTAGDTSITQYALLGLWEAESVGADVPPEVWDRAASWFLSVQSSGGSWNYHRDEAARYPETMSMTAAGIGSLMICQRQLSRHRRGGDDAISPLLTPLITEGQRGPYAVKTPAAQINQGIRDGVAWLSRNFTMTDGNRVGQSVYYGLYGVERIVALNDQLRPARDWYEQGKRFILSNQQQDGTWNATHGPDINTAWAILFLTQSTAKTVRRIEIQRLGAGTLLGGRGLPKDLSSLTVAQGRVMVRPMSGAVEEMLNVLEDPRVTDAREAQAGLVARYQREGPEALRPHKVRFRKLLTDPDPGVRRLAAWCLARTTDLDVVPDLILTLHDPEDDVMVEARRGLQLISRKLDDFGPSPGASEEERAQAVHAWRAWYQTVRPATAADDPDDDVLDDLPRPAVPTAAAPAPRARSSP